MRKVSLDEVFQLASEARESIWEQAKALGREPKIYLHWTAGHYHNLFADYHVNIDGDGQLWVEKDFDVKLKHTWNRNTGSIGVAICGCYGAGSQSLGAEPPTQKQIEMMAQVIWKIADALWLTIDKAHVLTHGEAANNEDGDFSCHDPYPWWNDSYGDGDTRGDLEYLGTEESPCYNPYATDGTRGGDVLRGKANWYRKEYGNKEG
jgi:hypothetical protein